MTPDNAEEEAVTVVRETTARSSNASHGHRHRRGKTGRKKKKRHWAFFSRWRTGESDDDDDFELYQWSKSRGLTARSLPQAPPPAATKPQQNQTRTVGVNNKESQESKSAIASRALTNNPGLKRAASADTINCMLESLFLTKLCAAISDKKSFVDQSKPPKVESQEPKKEQPVNQPPKKHVIRPTYSTQSLPLRKRGKEDEKTNHLTQKRPVSFTENEKPSLSGQTDSSSSKASIAKDGEEDAHSSLKIFPRKQSSTPTQPKKEWSANVESDILRLYESATTATSTTLVSSWATPFNAAESHNDKTEASDVTHAIDRKIERAEHTPSYVQALAKMFRSRMQMRKEREQRIENETKKVRKTFDVENDEKKDIDQDAESEKKSITSDSQSSLMSTAHLRYRHLNSENRPSASVIHPSVGRLSLSQLVRVEPLHREPILRRRSGDVLQCNYTTSNNQGASLRSHLNSRSMSPSREPHAVNPLLSNSKNMQEGIEMDSGIGDSEDILNSINAKLDNDAETCAEEFPLYKLNISSEIQKLSNPAPSFISNPLQDTRSAQVLARKAKQCLLSNSRLKITDKGSGRAMKRHVVQRRDDLRVRWPTSVGTLYHRPEPKLLSKATIQRA